MTASAPRVVLGGEAVLPLEWPIDLGLTVASHGWAHLAPWHWEPDTGRLARRELIAGRLGSIEAAQSAPDALLVRWTGFGRADEAAVLARVRRWVSADWEPWPAMAALGAEAALIRRGGGRILRCSSFYEDFVKTILTINTSWSSTVRMAAALVAEPGGGAFPEPAAMLDYGEARLRERAKLGFRAPTVIAATRRLVEDSAIELCRERRPRPARPRLSDRDQGHRTLRRGALPAVAARFLAPSGQFLGHRLFARPPRLRPRCLRRRPLGLGSLSGARLPPRPPTGKARRRRWLSSRLTPAQCAKRAAAVKTTPMNPQWQKCRGSTVGASVVEAYQAAIHAADQPDPPLSPGRAAWRLGSRASRRCGGRGDSITT